MNSKCGRIVFCAVVLSLAGVYGCSNSSREEARAAVTDTTSERVNVRKALDRFFYAVDKKDWKMVEEILAADFQFYGDHLMVLNRSQFIDAMREDDMKIDKFDLKDVTIDLSPDGQMAWARYRAHLESTMRDGPYNMDSAETVVLRKEQGNWKLTHNHASVKKL